jgi:hypothetical protein
MRDGKVKLMDFNSLRNKATIPPAPSAKEEAPNPGTQFSLPHPPPVSPFTSRDKVNATFVIAATSLPTSTHYYKHKICCQSLSACVYCKPAVSYLLLLPSPTLLLTRCVATDARAQRCTFCVRSTHPRWRSGTRFWTIRVRCTLSTSQRYASHASPSVCKTATESTPYRPST